MVLSVLCAVVLFCLGFGIIVWLFLPKAVWKNSLVPRHAFYGQFSGVNLWFKALLSVLCALVLLCGLPRFWHYNLVVSSRKLVGKILLFLGMRLRTIFGSSFSRLPPLSPPLCSWGRPGFSFISSLCVCVPRHTSTILVGTALHAQRSFSLFPCLSARAGSPLPIPSLLFLYAFLFCFPLSLSLSLSLFFSLACA